MEKGFDIEAQKEELRQINNQLALLMAKKRAIQKYLKKEASNEENIKQRIIELRNDKVFYKENGRSRYYWEIANEVGYSESSVKRIFKDIKFQKWSIMIPQKLIPRFFYFVLKYKYWRVLWKNIR